MDPLLLRSIIDIIFAITIICFCLYILLLSHSLVHWELPYVPTLKQARKYLAKHLKIKPNERILDMGSGLGKMLVFFSKYPVHVTGIEKKGALYICSKIRLFFHFFKKAKVEIKHGSFFDEDLSKYTLIYCFHITAIIKKVAPKVEEELSKDAILISYKFPYPLDPKRFTEEKFEDYPGSFLYFYKRK